MGQLHFRFLAICETGHMLPFHKRLALVGHMAEDAGRMAHQGNYFAGIVEGLEQCD